MRSIRLPEVVIATTVLVCTAVALRFVTVGDLVTDPWLLSLCIILPAAVALGLAATFFATRALRVNVALAIGATAFSLWLLEAVITLMPLGRHTEEAAAERQAAAAAAGMRWDERSRAEVLRNLRAAGMNASVTIPWRVLRGVPSGDDRFELVVDGRRIVPLGNISRRTTVHCNETGVYSIFRTDEHGYNNPEGLWEVELELAALGDSYIQGACVDSSQTLVARLRGRHAATIGLGLDGFGPLALLALMKEYLPSRRPADVLFFYYEGNDLNNLSVESRFPPLRRYLDAGYSQGLAAYQDTIDKALGDFVARSLEREPATQRADDDAEERPRLARGGIAGFFNLYTLRARLGLNELSWRASICCDVALLETILLDAQATAAGWGGRLHFIYLPSADRYAGLLAWLPSASLRARGRVLERVRQAGIPVVDLHSVFLATGQPRRMYVSRRSHFGPEGYRVAAEAVLHHLDTFREEEPSQPSRVTARNRATP